MRKRIVAVIWTVAMLVALALVSCGGGGGGSSSGSGGSINGSSN